MELTVVGVGAGALAQEALVLHLLAHNAARDVDLFASDYHLQVLAAVSYNITGDTGTGSMCSAERSSRLAITEPTCTPPSSDGSASLLTCVGKQLLIWEGLVSHRTTCLPASACFATTDARRPSMCCRPSTTTSCKRECRKRSVAAARDKQVGCKARNGANLHHIELPHVGPCRGAQTRGKTYVDVK